MAHVTNPQAAGCTGCSSVGVPVAVRGPLFPPITSAEPNFEPSISKSYFLKHHKSTEVLPPPTTGRYNPLTHTWLKEPANKKSIDADVTYTRCRTEVSPGYLGNYNVLTNEWLTQPANPKYHNANGKCDTNVNKLPKKGPGVPSLRVGVLNPITQQWKKLPKDICTTMEFLNGAHVVHGYIRPDRGPRMARDHRAKSCHFINGLKPNPPSRGVVYQ
mmetsp:Transcript_40501/g.67869  ORF Transcript_40501/g.67869 Transcript_40501/m.67869 type:complete len:216 (-) Transcript_40501:478-1125(-)